jgi:hypothetical protein
VSRLRRPFLSDRFFFVTVRLLKRRSELLDADFHFLALVFRRARVVHPFFLTAWVSFPITGTPSALRCIRSTSPW